MKNIIKSVATIAIMLSLLNSNKALAKKETENLVSQGLKSLISLARSHSKTTTTLVVTAATATGLVAAHTLNALPDNPGQTKKGDEKKEILVTSHGFSSTRHRYTFCYSKNFGIDLPFLRKFPLWKRNRYITNGPIKTFSYSDVLFGCLPITPWKTSLGQYRDMKKYADKCGKALDEGFREINGHGISRGAAGLAILTMTNKKLFEKEKKLKEIKNDGFSYEKLKEIRKHLKTVIVESPFEHAESVFANHILIKALTTMLCTSPKNFYRFIQKFTKYKDKGIQPIECAQNMAEDSKRIGKLVVLSLEDILVTPDSSIKLAIEMIKNDPKHTHVLILEHGKHGNLLNGLDGEKYRNVMHAFYEKYGARHNKEFAASGKQHFQKCKPSPRELKTLLRKLEKNKKQQSAQAA